MDVFVELVCAPSHDIQQQEDTRVHIIRKGVRMFSSGRMLSVYKSTRDAPVLVVMSADDSAPDKCLCAPVNGSHTTGSQNMSMEVFN